MDHKINCIEYLNIIKQVFKELNIIKYEANFGYNGFVLIINNTDVFKFPFNLVNAKNILNKEKLVTDSLHGFVNTIIPKMEIYTYNNYSFSHYNIIHGTLYSDLNIKEKQMLEEELSSKIAEFISKMHSVNCSFLRISNNVICDFLINQNFEIIIKYLNTEFKIEDFKKTLKYLEDQNISKNNLVLSHNDLNPRNIIVDLERATLAGIIDFGNVKVQNYNIEFSIMTQSSNFLFHKVVEKYQNITNKIVDVKLSLYIEKMRAYGRIGLALNNSNEKIKNFELKDCNNILIELYKFQEKNKIQ